MGEDIDGGSPSGALRRPPSPLPLPPSVWYVVAMRVVVSGATGFLGRTVLRSLVARGHDAVGLVRTEAAVRELAREGLRARTYELGDPRSIAEATGGAAGFVHAAGSSDPRATAMALGWLHVAGTNNALRGAKHAGARRFVLISCSDATLTGEERKAWPADRVSPLPAIDALARTKREAEEAALALGTESFETVVIRPGFVWGPGDRTNLPRLAAEGLAGGIRILGRGLSFFPTTHVDNVSVAVERALLVPAARGAIYYTLDREVVLQRPFFDRLSIALGVRAPRRGGSLRLETFMARARGALGRDGLTVGEIARRAVTSAFDTRRTTEELGFDPPVTIEEGMESLAAYVREIGGPSALVAMARPVLGDDDVRNLVGDG